MLSALDVEREIVCLQYVAEAAVVGVEDDEYGQKVAAAVILQPETPPLAISMTVYKMPTLLRIVDQIDKNATGEVDKRKLKADLFPQAGHEDIQK
jgi:malonyl-CoA/methylmalonyl-CoA synthetase